MTCHPNIWSRHRIVHEHWPSYFRSTAPQFLIAKIASPRASSSFEAMQRCLTSCDAYAILHQKQFTLSLHSEFERDGAVLVVDDTSLGFVKGATVSCELDVVCGS